MKNLLLTALTIALSGLFFLNCFMFPDSHEELTGQSKLEKSKLATTNPDSFAVVELFTSEGCSSCPPADELMAKLQQNNKDKNIYFLAYHVDYWDRLGWKDQFSSNDFTIRQQPYQDWLKLFVMYTPQFIINGSAEFAGYNETALTHKIAEALKTNQTETLQITVATSKDSIAIDFKTNTLQKNSSLFIAVVQKHGTTKVERGENSGNILHHVQIARQLKSFPLPEKEGKVNLALPSLFNTKDFELIGFIQNTETGTISAATQLFLVETEGSN